MKCLSLLQEALVFVACLSTLSIYLELSNIFLQNRIFEAFEVNKLKLLAQSKQGHFWQISKSKRHKKVDFYANISKFFCCFWLIFGD